MARGGSKPGERRGGRKAGTPNKITATIKAAIEASFDKVGGVDYLVRMATEQPTAYMTLLGKVLPTQMEHSNPDGSLAPRMFDVSKLSTDALREITAIMAANGEADAE